MPSLPKFKKSGLRSTAVTWGLGLVAILGLGLAGLAGLLYLRGVLRVESDYGIGNVPPVDDPNFALILKGLTNSTATTGQLIGFWDEVDDIYAARWAAIAEAERLIQYETYFMTPGRRAEAFAEAIIDRALTGVRVQLLFDHHGTEAMPEEYWEQLRNAGIEIQFFREPNWRAPMEYNSRTHRKLLLIDGQRVYIGGAGISDYWDGTEFDHDTAPWLDFEIAYEGEVVNILQGKFLRNWAYAGGQINLDRDVQPMPVSAEALPEETSPEAASPEAAPQTETPLYITDDTSSLNESAIRMLMQISMLTAQQRLWIGSPYFVPDGNTTRALLQAHEDGVDVQVLTMGDATDKRMVHLASRELYGPLLQAGIPICEYQPSMMHAKFMLVDDAWVSTGSANFDPRSYFHNDELNVSGVYPALAQEVEQFFISALPDSQCLTYAEWQNRPRTEVFRGRAALLLKNLF